ncbi:glycoside hydrolase family 5 protein [Prevotella sp. PCHR]|uniref:Glycoside hydrolase family 5 protein n=3 Tax=Xylanibacter caecicola TaxID=2736294 RepID=A0ABX2B7L5_9BACT|nr:glycoside hydrolase family 5 protein [Xylanibacter caecicola]NPE25970.1 glycoside hydrolase family 5 protein [Xylanibacter caecicola]
MKKFYFIAALVSGLFLIHTAWATIVDAGSDAPATFPADPTANQNDVLALYSSHYTPATSFTGGSGVGNVSEVNVHVGSETRPMLYVKAGLGSWSFAEFAAAQNISEYTKMEFDVYNTQSEFVMKIRLNESSGYQIAKKIAAGWNHVSIDLSVFDGLAKKPDMTAIKKFGLINAGGNARTIYIDNVYFVKGESGDPGEEVSDAPTTLPAPPEALEDDVLAFYSSHYTPATTWNKTGAVNVGSVEEKHITIDGKTMPMLYLKDGLNSWSYFCFNDALDISQYEKLEMDVFNPKNSVPEELSFQLKVRLSTTSSSVTVTPDLPEGWTHVVIDLDDYAKVQNVPNLKSVSQIGVINGLGHARNIYVANIYASGKKTGGDIGEVDPDAPAIPAPTPKHQQQDVLSFYSSHYTNGAEITLENAGDPVCSMEEINVEGNKYLRFWGMNWCLLRLTPEVNLDDYDYIHVDVYTKKDPKIVFDFGNGTANGRTPWQYLTPMQWKSINIPIELLKEKDATLSNLSLIRLFCATGFPIEKLYFDNFYAFKGSPSGDIITYEIPQAPTPIMPKNATKCFMTDKYDAELAPVVDNAGTAKVTFPKIEESDRVAKFDNMNGSASIKLENSIDLTGEEYLHLNIYRKNGNAPVTLAFKSEGGTDYKPTATQLEVLTKQWVYVNIPVSELTAAGVDITKFSGIQMTSEGTVYLDNVFAFHGTYNEGLGEDGVLQIDWDEAKRAYDLLDPEKTTFMGVNLASACGGRKHGVLNQQYFYPTKEDLWYFKSRGVRMIRFPFAWERVQHELGGELDKELDIAKMKEVMDECQRLGIHVMLDMHNYCRYKVGETTYKFGDTELKPEHFADVWKKLATEFKDYSNLYGYDIMNEPYGLIPGKWAIYAQAAIDAIREVDTTTPIVIEGESYASAKSWNTTGAPLANKLIDSADKIIWQAHKYFDKEGSGHYVLGSYEEEMVSATQHIDGISPFVEWCVANGKRGILGEFGVPEYDSRWLKVLDDVCSYLKENNIDATYWVGGNGYINDPVSVQPAKEFTLERAQMRVLRNYFNGYDVSTAIENIDNPVSSVTSNRKGIYTITGQKLENTAGHKGILIINGKKVVKK